MITDDQIRKMIADLCTINHICTFVYSKMHMSFVGLINFLPFVFASNVKEKTNYRTLCFTCFMNAAIFPLCTITESRCIWISICPIDYDFYYITSWGSLKFMLY